MSTDIAYDELGKYPIEIIIKTRMIGYWSRLITSKTTKSSMVMYTSLLYLDPTGICSSPWINHIRKILNSCDMSGIWFDRQVNSPEWLKKAVERKLKDHWITTWHSNITTQGICKNYDIGKELYALEDYRLKLRKNIRISLTKITNNYQL